MLFNKMISTIFRDALNKASVVEQESASIHEMSHLERMLTQHGFQVSAGASVHDTHIEYHIEVPDADTYEHVREILELTEHSIGSDLMCINKVGCRVGANHATPEFSLYYPCYATREAAHA